MHAFIEQLKSNLMKKTILINILMQLVFYALVYLVTLI